MIPTPALLRLLAVNFSRVYLRNLTERVPANCHASGMGKTAMVIVAEGSEEMEFVISADVLRRAGVDVTVAGIPGSDPVKCSRGVFIKPEISFEEAVLKGPYDAVVLPGGLGGAKTFASSVEVGDLLKKQEESGRIIAAICAAPTALKAHKIGLGKSITSYPSFKEDLAECFKYSEDKVVIDGNLITSRGPGTAFDFALAVSKCLVGEEKVLEVKKGLLL